MHTVRHAYEKGSLHKYFLRPTSGAGYLLYSLQQILLQGKHAWEDAPSSEGWYIAGMDVAGEDHVIPFTFTRPSKSRLAYQLLASFLSTRNSQSGTMLCTGLPYRRLHTPIFRKEKTYATRTQKTSTGEY